MEEAEESAVLPSTRARHIKKRALKNKALSVSFDEKDLRDYVTGFHKRKKKRRKEAELQLQEVHRQKRIEARKKRKMERELAYGGAPAETSAEPDKGGEDTEQDEELTPVPSVCVEGTSMYESGNLRVVVKTSEISREEESPSERPLAALVTSGGDVKKQHKVAVTKKKSLKRVVKTRSRKKQQKKRDIKKGKTMNNKS